jgi:hypothetical protein
MSVGTHVRVQEGAAGLAAELRIPGSGLVGAWLSRLEGGHRCTSRGRWAWLPETP